MRNHRPYSIIGLSAAALAVLIAGACGPPPEPQSVQDSRANLEEAWAADPRVRELVLTLVADHPDLPYSRRVVEESLASAAGAQRLEAVAVLSRWQDPSTADQITPLLDDSNEVVRLVAAETLARLGNEAGLSILEGAIRGQDGLLLSDRCAALARVGSEVCIDEAKKDLRANKLPTIAAASDVLGTAGGDEAAGALRQALKSQRGERRAPVIEALGRAGGEPDVDRVLPYIKYRENVLAVIRALGSLGGPKAVATLEKYAEEKDPLARLEAAGGLLRLGAAGESALAAFDEAAQSERTDLRYLAARILSDAPADTDVSAMLFTLAQDEDPQVRREALRAVAERATVAAVPVLQGAWDRDSEASDGPAYEAAQLALLAAGRIDTPESEALLVAALESGNWAHVIQSSLGLLELHAARVPPAGS